MFAKKSSRLVAFMLVLAMAFTLGAEAVGTSSNNAPAYLTESQEVSPEGPQPRSQIYQKTIRVSDGTLRDEFYYHGTSGFRWYCENNGTAPFTLEVRLPNGNRVAKVILNPGNTFYSDYGSSMPQGLYDFSINNTDGSDLDCLFRVNLLQ